MSVVVTGATGFIGSHLVRTLVREGYEVHALVRPRSDLWRIADVAPSIRIIRGDLSTLGELAPRLRDIRPKACFHLGWCPAVPGEYLETAENVRMLEAGIQLGRCLADASCEVLIGIGTCLEYDTDHRHLSEGTPTRPRSLYAATKLSLGVTLTSWAAVSGLRVVWARLFQEYGPYEHRRRLVPSIVLSLLDGERFRPRTGGQVRDYLSVEDVAEALRLLMECDVRGPINVGSGVPISVSELARKVGVVLGRDDLIEPGDDTEAVDEPAFICADNRALRAQTGWRPAGTLEEGLARCAEWWRGRAGVRA